jgi:hypothetical protein
MYSASAHRKEMGRTPNKYPPKTAGFENTPNSRLFAFGSKVFYLE